MRLIIPLNHNYMDREHFFKSYIPNKMYDYLQLNVDENRCNLFDNYLKSKYNFSMSCRDILEYAIKNIWVDDNKAYFTASINNNIKIPGTYTNLIEVVKLITYGNLEIKGYPILSNLFYYFKNSWDDIYREYKLKRRVRNVH